MTNDNNELSEEFHKRLMDKDVSDLCTKNFIYRREEILIQPSVATSSAIDDPDFLKGLVTDTKRTDGSQRSQNNSKLGMNSKSQRS